MAYPNPDPHPHPNIIIQLGDCLKYVCHIVLLSVCLLLFNCSPGTCCLAFRLIYSRQINHWNLLLLSWKYILLRSQKSHTTSSYHRAPWQLCPIVNRHLPQYFVIQRKRNTTRIIEICSCSCLWILDDRIFYISCTKMTHFSYLSNSMHKWTNALDCFELNLHVNASREVILRRLNIQRFD